MIGANMAYDRLILKVPRLIESEAVGRYAITALLVTVALRFILVLLLAWVSMVTMTRLL
jgi:hypothetical protein